MVLKKGNNILILDITVYFENGLNAFVETRRLKEEKYRNIDDELSVDCSSAMV